MKLDGGDELTHEGAFGAKIDIVQVDNGLYLVTGRSVKPFVLVKAVGGQVLYAIPNSFSVLAILPARAFLSIRKHRDVAHAGPVTVDGERFNRFVTLIGAETKAARP